VADIPESTKSEHVSWTVNATSYLRNLDSEDLDAETIAVHYQKAPEKTETGTRISLCFPTLIVSGYCSEPREVADRVARILNAHWDEPAAPPAMDREAAYRQALEDVCNPLGYLQRMADAEGAKLSGMAYAIASDIGTIQRIAKEALSTLSADAIRQGEGEAVAAIGARTVAVDPVRLAERFCATPLPETVCADLCATQPGAGRYGTHLMTVAEAAVVFRAALSTVTENAAYQGERTSKKLTALSHFMGEQTERENVVAWLRTKGDDEAADAIELGSHVPATPASHASDGGKA